MASAAGSNTFAIVALLCISLLVLLLLRHFLPLRSAPAYLVFPVFLSLALPASIILLVPIDLASSARVEDETSKGIWLPERAVLVTWRIAYWLTFTLTWLVARRVTLSQPSTDKFTGLFFLYLANTWTLVIVIRKLASYIPSAPMESTS
jgi:hypothetical protein